MIQLFLFTLTWDYDPGLSLAEVMCPPPTLPGGKAYSAPQGAAVSRVYRL
jgi:hypothetical protein